MAHGQQLLHIVLPWEFKDFSQHSTKTYILAQNKPVSNVVTRETAACSHHLLQTA